VVDQGENEIAGYVNDVEPIKAPLPLVVFGDHTRNVKFADRPFVVGADGVKLLRPKDQRIGARYLYWLTIFAGSRIPNLGYSRHFSSLREVVVPVLESAEARAKAAFYLDRVQHIVDTLSAVIAAKREFKRGLMQELLTGRRRFPEFEGRPVEKCPFGSIVELRNEHYFPDKSNPRRCIELEHIESGTGRITGETLTTSENSVKFAFSAGDVLFGRLRPYLKKYAFPSFSGVCSTEIWVLRPRSADLLPEFLFLLVQGEEVQRAANVTSGSKMPRASWAVVAQALVPMPTIEEQRKICDIIASLDRELAALTELATHYQAQRRGLMQKLLTGELAVPVSSEPEPVHA
jgi:type I restriction enzyme S subunit